MKGLTERQRQVLDFIQEYIQSRRYSPTYREIQEHFGFSSLGSVFKYINILKRKGMLTSEKQSSRSLMPSDFSLHKETAEELLLPFIGHLSAGIPIETFPRSQTLAVPPLLVQHPESTYVLRVRGDSFQEELIADGDLLIVEARNEALAGEQILGALHERKTLIKHYFPEGNSFRLTSRTRQEIVVRQEDLTIQGVLVGLLRLF